MLSESEAYFRLIVITSSYESNMNAVSKRWRRVFVFEWALYSVSRLMSYWEHKE